uniref:Uncharacterized protein n=1 Tax=Romanomermis culicivorax TaxID=13658 RepID=A0A915JRH5_ROMCU
MTFEPPLTISGVSGIGDHAVERRPKEIQIIHTVHPTIFTKNMYAVYPNANFTPPWEQHIHYNAVLTPYVTRPMDSSCASSQS